MARGPAFDPRLLSGEASPLEFAEAVEAARLRFQAIVALRDAAALSGFFDAHPEVAAVSHAEVHVGRGDYEDRYFALTASEAAASVRFDSSRPPGPERDRDCELGSVCLDLSPISQTAIQNRTRGPQSKDPLLRAPFFELAERLANNPAVRAALAQAAVEAACAEPSKSAPSSL